MTDIRELELHLFWGLVSAYRDLVRRHQHPMLIACARQTLEDELAGILLHSDWPLLRQRCHRIARELMLDLPCGLSA